MFRRCTTAMDAYDYVSGTVVTTSCSRPLHRSWPLCLDCFHQKQKLVVKRSCLGGEGLFWAGSDIEAGDVVGIADSLAGPELFRTVKERGVDDKFILPFLSSNDGFRRDLHRVLDLSNAAESSIFRYVLVSFLFVLFDVYYIYVMICM